MISSARFYTLPRPQTEVCMFPFGLSPFCRRSQDIILVVCSTITFDLMNNNLNKYKNKYLKCVCINMCTLSQLLGAEKAWKCLNDWTELKRRWRNASAIHLCCWLKATKCIFQVEVQRIFILQDIVIEAKRCSYRCKHWIIIAVWWNIKPLVW